MESALAAGAVASLAGFEQPASNAPADAAIIVRPKLRLVNRVGAWLSELEIPELQELHPFVGQLLQSLSFLPDASRIFFIVILIKLIQEYIHL
jgi:hypothetical protein